MAAVSSNGTGGGDWGSTATWSGGVVPGASDQITIVSGDTVIVDDTLRAADTIDVNGELAWSTIADSTLTSGTITVNGTLTMGSVATPMPADYTATLNLNTNAGVEVKGSLNLYAEDFVFKTVATSSIVGSSFDVADATNWQSGDSIVIFSGLSGSDPEFLTIDTVSGNSITTTAGPSGSYSSGFHLYNYSRFNIFISGTTNDKQYVAIRYTSNKTVTYKGVYFNQLTDANSPRSTFNQDCGLAVGNTGSTHILDKCFIFNTQMSTNWTGGLGNSFGGASNLRLQECFVRGTGSIQSYGWRFLTCLDRNLFYVSTNGLTLLGNNTHVISTRGLIADCSFCLPETNSGNNVRFQLSGLSQASNCDFNVYSGSSNKDIYNYSSASGTYLNCRFGDKIVNFARAGAGVSLLFQNCRFASGVKTVSDSVFDVIGSEVRNSNFSQSVLNQAVKKYGGLLERDNTIYDPAGSDTSSMRLTPASASIKLKHIRTVAVSANSAQPVLCRVRVDSTYNGNDPTISIDGLDVTTPPVSSVDASITDVWQTVIVTLTETSTQDRVLEVTVDCDGTAGFINVDSFSAPPVAAIDTGGYAAWVDALPASLITANFVSPSDVWASQSGVSGGGTYGEVLDALLSMFAGSYPGGNEQFTADALANAPSGGSGGLTQQQVRDALKLAPTAGSPDAGSIDAELAEVLADTDELQTDWADNGRLDLILDSVLEDTAEIGAAGLGLTEAGGTGDQFTALPNVTVGTNNDKTGYSLTQSFPTNFDTLAIDGGGQVTAGNMRGTDGANTVAPDNTGIAANGIAIAGIPTNPLLTNDARLDNLNAAVGDGQFTASDRTQLNEVHRFRHLDASKPITTDKNGDTTTETDGTVTITHSVDTVAETVISQRSG